VLLLYYHLLLLLLLGRIQQLNLMEIVELPIPLPELTDVPHQIIRLESW